MQLTSMSLDFFMLETLIAERIPRLKLSTQVGSSTVVHRLVTRPSSRLKLSELRMRSCSQSEEMILCWSELLTMALLICVLLVERK